MVIDEELKKYCKEIKEYIYNSYLFHCHAPIEGKFNHPYFTSGIDYSKQVWDWGCWQCSIALHSIKDKTLEEAQKGIVLNFLDSMDEEGRMEILISTEPLDWIPEGSNIYKPAMFQHIYEICEKYNDYEWIKDYFLKALKYLQYYHKHQFEEESGLYVWLNDFALGFDNDPTAFYHQNKTVGAIFLNSLMYAELLSCSKVAGKLGYIDIQKEYEQRAENLKTAIRNECYDPIDGYFYSADVSLRKVNKNEWLHSNHPRFWHSLPIKITTWAGMLPLWNGVATQEQAEACVKRYLNKEGLFSDFGIRGIGMNEKMFCQVDTCNPSCWLGTVWINANWFTYEGLKRYGFTDLANDLAIKTLRLLGKDLHENGGFHEYYNSITGEGIRGLGMHGWNFLALRIIDDLGIC